jgi:hypothetical protein
MHFTGAAGLNSFIEQGEDQSHEEWGTDPARAAE